MCSLYANNFYIFRDRIGIQSSVDLCAKPELVLEGFLQIGRLKNINGFDFESMKKIRESVSTIDPKFFLSQEAGNQFINILKSPIQKHLGTSCFCSGIVLMY